MLIGVEGPSDTVKFPNTLKIRGMAFVDEAGNVLGGTTPVKVSPKGLEILSRVQIFEGRAWTPPTLVGKKLYVRNRKDIMAYQIP